MIPPEIPRTRIALARLRDDDKMPVTARETLGRANAANLIRDCARPERGKAKSKLVLEGVRECASTNSITSMSPRHAWRTW